MHIILSILFVSSLFLVDSHGFSLIVRHHLSIPVGIFRRHASKCIARQNLQTSATTSTAASESNNASSETIDPKVAVLVFGRLAEKYIALDSSGGDCCYSGCSDCEYRLPGGGYIMADQSAARPKWIPHYQKRSTTSREHVTTWSQTLFGGEGIPIDRLAFYEAVQNLSYAPPLGGPYVGASAAKDVDIQPVADRLFHVLTLGTKNRTTLTPQYMSRRIKELSNGEEGMTWNSFQRALETVE